MKANAYLAFNMDLASPDLPRQMGRWTWSKAYKSVQHAGVATVAEGETQGGP